MTFRVGQKVVCVDANSETPGLSGGWQGDPLVQMSVYTVIGIGPAYDDSGEVVWLSEAKNRVFDGRWRENVGYLSSRFRPAVKRKTDISIFTKMLTGKKVDA